MQLNKYVLFVNLICMGISCKNKQDILYKSDAFTLYSDQVIQGDYVAKAVSPTKIISNYQSDFSRNYSKLVTFKFSINEKDNEKPSGADHWIIIQDELKSPVITFGQENSPIPSDPGTKLPENYKYTFRVDMNPVLKQFESKGYYEAFDGTHVAEEDFNAVYIAGGAEPLTWDFSNLEENNLELKDPDGDGIYELTVMLNPSNAEENKTKEWVLSSNKSAKPSYSSDQKIVDALFNLSLEEALLNIEPDSTLRTGAKWGGVWTRDVSYSILLAFAYHEPEIAKISLMKKVNRGRIIQDTGSGGAWPVSSDRTTWALAAWEIYTVTGDEEWLKKAYSVIKNTLEDDYKVLSSEKTGMYLGESSFLDWREQTYPKWMSNKDIYHSETLGTNAVHYQAHIICAKMAEILGEPADEYLARANQIKEGINRHLWIADKGYYGQYLYGRTFLNRSTRFEALGEALSVLFEVASREQAVFVLANSPVTAYGTTCIYPQIPGVPPYHNNGIWPFVQAFWNLAAAKAGNQEVLNHGLAAIYRAGALFLTNYENFVAETGDFAGTEINSHRMLWSMAGNLAMVHRVFMGISFEVDGIRFNPVIPETYNGTKTLTNFKYRNATLDITVKGFGNEIASVKQNGEIIENSFLPASISGRHQIEIQMKNNDFGTGGINLVENKFSLPAPQVRLKNKQLVWEKVDGAVLYNIYKNGALMDETKTNSYDIHDEHYSEFSVVALDAEGIESFGSEPVMLYNIADEHILEIENYLPKSQLQYTNYSGNGFIETTPDKNTSISFPVNIDEQGKYRIDFRYSNGSGPWNTDNNCGIRSLYIDGAYEGALVFPQRGDDEWSDWGFSNSRLINLNQGIHTINIEYKPWNINMDVEINDVMLDYVRFIRLP